MTINVISGRLLKAASFFNAISLNAHLKKNVFSSYIIILLVKSELISSRLFMYTLHMSLIKNNIQ